MNLDQLRKLLSDDTLDRLRAKMKDLDEIDRKMDDLHNDREKIMSELSQFTVAVNAPRQRPRQATTGRRTGIRSDVFNAVKELKSASPADIRKHLGIDGKQGSQSVANAISALKREGAIVEVAPRRYAEP